MWSGWKTSPRANCRMEAVLVLSGTVICEDKHSRKSENNLLAFNEKKNNNFIQPQFQTVCCGLFSFLFPLPPGWWWWCCVCGYVSAFLDVLVAPDGRVARQWHQTLGRVTDGREAYQRRTRTGAVQLPPDAFYLRQRNKWPEISFVSGEGQRGNHW